MKFIFTAVVVFFIAQSSAVQAHDQEGGLDDSGFVDLTTVQSCKKATFAEMAVINEGNSYYKDFMEGCEAATNGSHWCNEIIRPNPQSAEIFSCTYGPMQAHQLI